MLPDARMNAGGPIQNGWNLLKAGGGGLETGLAFAADGTILCRNDGAGVYLWSGTTDTMVNHPNSNDRWVNLCTPQNIAGVNSYPNSNGSGGFSVAVCASNSNYIAMITGNFVLPRPTTGSPPQSAPWSAFFSKDRGQTFTGVLPLLHAGANGILGAGGYDKLAEHIAYDPINPNIIYFGFPQQTRLAWGNGGTTPDVTGENRALLQSTDGVPTFTDISANLPGFVGPVSGLFGCANFAFDTSNPNGAGGASTTTAYGGQKVTARVFCTVDFQGMYESLDGGVTWTEILVGNGGPGLGVVSHVQIDASGVVYFIFNPTATYVNPDNSQAFFWRYDRSQALGSRWTNISAGSTWPFTAGLIAVALIDPRPGKQGICSIADFNGGNRAGSSRLGATNVNGAVNSINWSRATSNTNIIMQGNTFDAAWQQYAILNLAYYGFTIDPYLGQEWWCGNQSIWFIQGGPYDARTATTMVNVGTCRGIENTVALTVCKPPHTRNVIMMAEDMGSLTTQVGAAQYPGDYWPRARVDGSCADWSVSDPYFCVVRAMAGVGGGNVMATGYSFNSGNEGSWNLYTTQPDTIWQSELPPGQLTNGGQIAAFDHDRIIIIGGTFLATKPLYCTNGTSASPTNWAHPVGLPSDVYMPSSFHGFDTPLALDRDPSNFGTAYLCQSSPEASSNPSVFWRSTDFGASWTQVSTKRLADGGNYTNVLTRTIPYAGYPGHVWQTMSYSGTGSTFSGLYWSSDGLNTWENGGNKITMPSPGSGNRAPFNISFGPKVGTYPRLYLWLLITDQVPNGMPGFYTDNANEPTGNPTWHAWDAFSYSAPDTLNHLPNSYGWVRPIGMFADTETPGLVYFANQGNSFAYYYNSSQ